MEIADAVIITFTGSSSYEKAMELATTIERATGLKVTCSKIDMVRMRDALIR